MRSDKRRRPPVNTHCFKRNGFLRLRDARIKLLGTVEERRQNRLDRENVKQEKGRKEQAEAIDKAYKEDEVPAWGWAVVVAVIAVFMVGLFTSLSWMGGWLTGKYDEKPVQKPAPAEAIVSLTPENGKCYFMEFNVDLSDPFLINKDSVIKERIVCITGEKDGYFRYRMFHRTVGGCVSRDPYISSTKYPGGILTGMKSSDFTEEGLDASSEPCSAQSGKTEDSTDNDN